MIRWNRAEAHHADIARTIVDSVFVDAHHTTEGELVAQARRFYEEYNRE